MHSARRIEGYRCVDERQRKAPILDAGRLKRAVDQSVRERISDLSNEIEIALSISTYQSESVCDLDF